MQDRNQQFKELFHSEYGRMYRAAYLLLGDEDEAQDAVQEVFARLWSGAIPLREESQRAFLLTCVRNRCLNIIMHRATVHHVSADLSAADREPQEPLSDTTDEELLQTINDYIDQQLSPQTSRIIRMRYHGERSYQEIARELGISLSAVNKHIVQGLRKLRSTFKNKEV